MQVNKLGNQGKKGISIKKRLLDLARIPEDPNVRALTLNIFGLEHTLRTYETLSKRAPLITLHALGGLVTKTPN